VERFINLVERFTRGMKKFTRIVLSAWHNRNIRQNG